VIQLITENNNGSICERFACYYDAVVCTEVIEHVHEGDELQCFEKLIFVELQPEIIIITTPNIEFNKWFFGSMTKFRHSDHKFEWTRDQFEKWTKHVVHLSRNIYSVRINGVGEGPDGDLSLGYATQIAVFTRRKEIANLAHRECGPFLNNLKLYASVQYEPLNCNEFIRDECIYAHAKLAQDEEYVPCESILKYLMNIIRGRNIAYVLKDKEINTAEQLAHFLCDTFPDDFYFKESESDIYLAVYRISYSEEEEEELNNHDELITNVIDQILSDSTTNSFEPENVWNSNHGSWGNNDNAAHKNHDRESFFFSN
jgi:hypothetical protein